VDFQKHTVPTEGYFSIAEQNWLLRPREEWVLRDGGLWLEVGSAGVDGIAFALRKGMSGIFAFYPIDNEFVWKADDGSALIAGWLSGSITV